MSLRKILFTYFMGITFNIYNAYLFILRATYNKSKPENKYNIIKRPMRVHAFSRTPRC